MTTLKFADTHNMVAFLSKPTESDGFEQIVDFLNIHPIRGEQLHALVDGKKIIITESSVRRDIQLADEEGKGFSGRVTPLFPTMVVQNQSQMGEGLAIPTDPHHTPTFIQPSPQPQKTQKPRKPKRKDTQIPQSSDPSDNVADEAVHKELGCSLVRAATTASSLEVEQDSGNITKTQSKTTPNESSSLGTTSGGGPRVVESSNDEKSLGEDASKQGRIDAIDADEDITLVSVHDEMEVDEEVVEVINTTKLIIDAAQVSAVGDKVSTASAATTVSAATTTTATTVDEITLAQVLEGMKSTKPKMKRVVIQELDQIMLDEETALNLQAEFNKEERLAREKAEKKEANIALIETWDDIQAKIDVDQQLAERLQA
ncbi:hypothetical protein Tco_0747384 [Tanacetum coccineum]|uniref:Uncharacterized protein n=1 Tax=Tanacetum coccineum TaxID=301880 RepID=A0ABQ4YW21_9ASTR